jgi:putative acetyltransferase
MTRLDEDNFAVTIRPATSGDREAIARLVTAAFGQPHEAGLVAALAAAGYRRVELVAEAGGEVLGHVLFSELARPGAGDGMLALAPLAVAPAHQRRGLGGALVRRGIEAARAAGYRAVLVVGDPDYYTRFGFDAGAARSLGCAYAGPHLMALYLHPQRGPLSGDVVYPPPFADLV